jgi:ethanolamine utilization protein EutM
MASEALGLLECKGLVALMEGTDAMLKAANVEMIGWDKAGSGLVTAFVKGDVAAVKASVDAGAEAAGRVGTVVSVHVIPRPHDDLGGMMPKKRGAGAQQPVGGRMAETIKK